MRIKYIFLGFGLVSTISSLCGQTTIDNYIAIALSNNESIKQQNFQIQRSLLALDEAKTLFLPNVSLQGNYFLAAGGRTVDFPAGDILNPVYSTLNQLTSSTNFPQIENQTILLNPNNFYDIKLRTTYPIINQEIKYNKRIKEHQVNLQKIEVNIYKRELVKDVKTAYFKYIQATEVIKIYETALKLVEENSRINTVLFKNDKVNKTIVLRSDNEVNKYQSQNAIATQNQKSALAYFNFLLNQPLSNAISIDSIYNKPNIEFLSDTTVNKREELLKLFTAIEINKEVLGLTKSALQPKLNTFIDLGGQGFDFRVNSQTPYLFFGLAFQWDIFDGGKNKLKVKQVEMDNSILLSQTDYAETQLKLQLNNAFNAFNASLVQYEFSLLQEKTSEQFYKDMVKIYKEGQTLFIELLDAQNQLINAKLQSNIALYDAWIKASEIERANASFNIKD